VTRPRTLIFSEANPNHLCNLHCLFLSFEVIFGVRINLAKLEIVPVGNVMDVEGLASLLAAWYLFSL
jgi:hypothetical protein